jgi:hypothetical protein
MPLGQERLLLLRHIERRHRPDGNHTADVITAVTETPHSAAIAGLADAARTPSTSGPRRFRTLKCRSPSSTTLRRLPCRPRRSRLRRPGSAFKITVLLRAQAGSGSSSASTPPRRRLEPGRSHSGLHASSRRRSARNLRPPSGLSSTVRRLRPRHRPTITARRT